MSDSLFFLQQEKVNKKLPIVRLLEEYSLTNNKQVFVIRNPLGDKKYSHEFEDGLLVLSPNHQIMILDGSNNSDDFEDYYEDIIEDIGSMSDKYQYKDVIGRVRKWREEIVFQGSYFEEMQMEDVASIFEESKVQEPSLQKKIELVISLLTGSINDIARVKKDIPTNILDKIKQKILIFDGEQTRFIYQEKKQNVIRIQGLSGTGKTELLLHKLKDIYTNIQDSKILFTCHNKILASTLKKRIPDFFNFMKVEEQIKWDERLWCVHAWGSQYDPDSGAYRFICEKYGLPFLRYSYSRPFSVVCRKAIDEIKATNKVSSSGYAFDYIFLDESQDFPDEFFELCELVTKEVVYVAGDIFQGIFDENIVSEVKPDFLLSKCYRTDPRTLMFAHGLGMGLFEESKLRWLSDEQWEACGYIIARGEGNLYLKREPLRRFEDIESSGIESMKLIQTQDSNNHATNVLEVIKDIVKNNPTVQPDDIGIVFSGGQKIGFRLADTLEHMVKQAFGWSLNKAYESKVKKEKELFFSNKNNVKGLEFPFLICVANYISDMKHERNALYMLLTRSFIQSYLIVSDSSKKVEGIADGLQIINKRGYMQIKEPSESEKIAINTNIDYTEQNYSAFDIAEVIFDELDLDPMTRESMLGLIKTMPADKITHEKVKDLVVSTLEKLNT